MAAGQDLETQSFSVQTECGEIEYPKTDEVAYGWHVGVAGELTIFKLVFHKTFSAVIKDERYVCYAPGAWQKVIVWEEGDE